jgi:hypothetical protein
VYTIDSMMPDNRLDDWVRSPAEANDVFSSLCALTGSEDHPAPYSVGTGGPFPWVKARPGRDADHSPHLVPRSRISRSYTASPLGASMAVAGQLYSASNRSLIQ